jgi:hypothetical protein
MWSKKEFLVLRILFVPISGFFAFQLFTHFGKSLNNLFYNFTEDYYLIYLRFDTLESVVSSASLIWMTAHLALEISAVFSENFRFKRLLVNLRYAPVVILFLSAFIVPAYDAAMIAYSKRQIRNYVFSASDSIAEPVLYLHNDYRHWCGNGFIAARSYHYFETATEGLSDENPRVRARALLMTEEVADTIINGTDKERFDEILKKSCLDSDSAVRRMAEKIMFDGGTDCRRFLISPDK